MQSHAVIMEAKAQSVILLLQTLCHCYIVDEIKYSEMHLILPILLSKFIILNDKRNEKSYSFVKIRSKYWNKE